MVVYFITRLTLNPLPQGERGRFAQHVFLAGFISEPTMTLQRIQLSVNGKPVEKEVETRKNLADFLRHDLSLTGTHVGCEHGVCGSCTVLYNGEPVRSCLMLAVQADQAEITTVEGLAENGALNSLQQAFKRHHALQCGFCTPGFLITATALLRKSDPLDETQVRKGHCGKSLPLHGLSKYRQRHR